MASQSALISSAWDRMKSYGLSCIVKKPPPEGRSPWQSARGGKLYAVKCAPVQGAEPDNTVLGRAPFPGHAKSGGDVFTSRPEVCPPCRGCLVLQKVCHPVCLLEPGVQFAEIAGQIVNPLLKQVDVDGPDELDLVAGVAVAPDIGGVEY